MPEGKGEDNAKKHVLAKIRTEMTDTIVRDSADLAGELMLINASIRAFNEKRDDASGYLVNKKLPYIIEKYAIVAQETEKRQKQFQDLHSQLTSLREDTKNDLEELYKVRARFGAAEQILIERKQQFDKLDEKLLEISSRKIEEINLIGELSQTFSAQLGFHMFPHEDGLRIKFVNGGSYIITNSSVLDAVTRKPLAADINQQLNLPNGTAPLLSDFDTLIKILRDFESAKHGKPCSTNN